MVLPDIIAQFASPIIILIYGYKSYKAIESEQKSDDEQWLTFWLIYSILNFIELWTDIYFIQDKIPFYTEIKLGLLIFLGFLNGSKKIYHSFVRPLLKQHEQTIDQQVVALKLKAEQYANQAEALAKSKANQASKVAAAYAPKKE